MNVDERVEEHLQHFGSKGMKWGVRKDRGHEGEKIKSKALPALDRRFANKSGSAKTRRVIARNAATTTKRVDLKRINKLPQYKNADLTKKTALRRKYDADVQQAFLNNLDKAAGNLGPNPSGTKRYSVSETASGSWEVRLKDVQHANDEIILVKVERSRWGHIESLDVAEEDVLVQAATFVDDYLEHFGSKGMKWGVRHNPDHSGLSSRGVKKADKAFEKNTNHLGTQMGMWNRAGERYDKTDRVRINNKPEYKGKKMVAGTALHAKFNEEHRTAFLKNFAQEADRERNASGTRKYAIMDHGDHWTVRSIDANHDWDTGAPKVQHAANGGFEFRVDLVKDELGHIMKVVINPPDVLVQAATFVDDYLEHFGIIGQKWGVRRNRTHNKGGSGGPPQNPATLAKNKRLDKKAAKEAAKADKKGTKPEDTGGKASGGDKKTKGPNKVKPMTDLELKSAVARMQLEKQYNQLAAEQNAAKMTNGQKFVNELKSGAVDIARQQGRAVGNAIVKQQIEKQFGLDLSGKKSKGKDKSNDSNDSNNSSNSNNKQKSEPKKSEPKKSEPKATKSDTSKKRASDAQRLSGLKPLKPKKAKKQKLRKSDSQRIYELTSGVQPIT